MRKAAEAGCSMPSRDDADYDRKFKMHEHHVAHNTQHHPKFQQLADLDKEAVQHRLAYKRFMRSKTTAALKPKYKKGTFEYHRDKGIELSNRIENDARKQSGYEDGDEITTNKARKLRVVKYMNALREHPDATDANKHLKLMLKLHQIKLRHLRKKHPVTQNCMPNLPPKLSANLKCGRLGFLATG